jgi:hypothetical protein
MHLFRPSLWLCVFVYWKYNISCCHVHQRRSPLAGGIRTNYAASWKMRRCIYFAILRICWFVFMLYFFSAQMHTSQQFWESSFQEENFAANLFQVYPVQWYCRGQYSKAKSPRLRPRPMIQTLRPGRKNRTHSISLSRTLYLLHCHFHGKLLIKFWKQSFGKFSSDIVSHTVTRQFN